MKHYNYLDGWRGIAILLVLASHFLHIHIVEVGRLGVDVFFALSGLLMARLLYEQRMPLATFYRRRLARILPAFLLFIGTLYAVQHLTTYVFPAKEALDTAFFLRTYWTPDIWHTSAPIGHIWSLNVEEHAYLIMSALTLPVILRGREGIVLAILCAVAGCIWLAYIKLGMPSTYNLRTECAVLFIFCSAAYSRLKMYLPWKPPAIFVALAVAAAAFCYTSLAPWWAEFLPGAFLGFAVNHLEDLPKLAKDALSIKPLRMFGLWSFSIYLWQQPFYRWALDKSPLETVGAFAAAMGIALASYNLVEAPLRTWINGLHRARTIPSAVIAS